MNEKGVCNEVSDEVERCDDEHVHPAQAIT